MILRLTDGTTTIDIGAGGQYGYWLGSNAWAPNVATLRRSTLGGLGPYGDVVERIPLWINGASAADALARLAALSQLLDQAERWARGEGVAAVLLQYQPEGSPALLQAAVLGRAENAPGVSLPATFNRELQAWVIDPVNLQLLRRGCWLSAADTPATSGAVANPGIASVTFATNAPVPSPVKVKLGVLTTLLTNGLVLYANAAARIQILEAETLAGVTYTSIADAANHASGGNVLRYTPVDTLMHEGSVHGVTLPATCRRVAVYSRVRNNSNAATFQISALVGFWPFSWVQGPTVIIPPYVGSAKPQTVFLGVISLLHPPQDFFFHATASTAVGPPTLDVDYFALLDVTDGQAGVVAYSALNASADEIDIDPQALTSPGGIVNAGSFALAYAGDAYAVHTGTVLAAAWLVDTLTAHWNLYVAGAFAPFTLTGTRAAAHTTPQ